MSEGRVASIQVSAGGVPKLPLRSPRAEVTSGGLAGDRQRNRLFHGGPARAVSLFSLEVIERLRAEGHPIGPGSAGENLTLAGLPWEELRPGRRLRFAGGVELELTSYCTPCKNIRGSFRGGDFRRISHKLHPGDSRLYARVVRAGTVTAGEAVWLSGPLC